MKNDGVTPEYQKKAEKFYKQLFEDILETNIRFIIGGTYAVKFYTNIDRLTKDIDFFIKASDYPKLMKALQDKGYEIEIRDERWLAKIHQNDFFADIIFGSIPGMWPITDDWLENANEAKLLGKHVRMTPPEELIVSKAYRMNRSGFDGADVAHIILKKGNKIDWKALLNRMEPNWEILLVHLLLFRFIYPSERDIIPEWLLKELLNRVKDQIDLPTPKDKVSRGSLLSPDDFSIAYRKWGFHDITHSIKNK